MGQNSRDRQRGSASVLVVAIGTCLVLFGVTVSALGTAIETRHRAQVGADTAALAAAMRSIEGSQVACKRAEQLAKQNGTTLTKCVLSDRNVSIKVTAELPRILSRFGPVQAVAAAGPVAGFGEAGGPP